MVPVKHPPVGSLIPSGRDPLATVHVRVPVPFEADRQVPYPSVTIPSGNEVVVIVNALTTLIASVLIATWPALSTARTTKLVNPVAVGIPVMWPLLPTVSPAGGSAAGAADQTIGAAPEAVRATSYGRFNA